MSTWKQMISDTKELLDMGAIAQEEFEQTKREEFVLRRQSTNPQVIRPPMPEPLDIEDIDTFVSEPSTVQL